MNLFSGFSRHFKKIFIIILGLFLLLTGYLTLLYFQEPNYKYLNFVQRYAARKIAGRFDQFLNRMPKDRRAIVDYDTLMNSLDPIEKDFASRIFDIDPKKLGFEGPFYSMSKPYDLKEIPSIKVGNRQTGIQYCPEHSYKDYLKMNAKMQKDIGRKLYIDSGYRSPGRQAYLFFHYLTTNSNYSLKENAKWIAMPGYSQHGSPRDNAIDFCTKDGINGFSDHQTADDFAKLPEYKWMLKNAAKFNFYLSYPENNKWGVAFEPWHWHWEKK
jgi:hypothetical protein